MLYRALLATLLALLAIPALSAQDDDLKVSAVADFKVYWKKNKDDAQRVEAIMTLKGNECVPAALELIQILDHKSDLIRAAALAVLSTYKDVRTFQGLIDQLKDMKEQPRRGMLIDVLGRAGIKDVLPVLRDIALNDKRADSFVRMKIAEAIGRLGDGSDSNPVLSGMLKDPDPTVRITAVDTVGQLRIKALGDEVVPLLDDKLWQVQAAAIEAVGKIRVEKAIDPLVELMRKEGRFKTDTAEALFLITTKDFGANPEQWTKSLQALRGFGWKMPSDEEVAKAKAARKRSDEYYGKKDGKKTFAKISTTSTRVLFIIDISGSMEDHIVEKAKFDAGYEDYQKLTIVKTELINTIDALDKNTLFNILAFATNLKPWKPGLVPANVVSKSAAKAFVKHLQPLGGQEAAEMSTVGLSSNLAEGRTNTFKALMYPFNIDPDKPQPVAAVTGGLGKEVRKSKLDTVFFLSDGRPSTGKYVDTEEILKEVARVNKVYRIAIHTIAIGQFQKEFLRTLALQNGGEFVDLGY